MRKILVFMFLYFVLITITNGQTPEKFNYQAIIRDNSGNLLIHQSINIRLTILDNNSEGTILYRERHTVTTSELGQINIQIGDGSIDEGSFENINWGINKKYLNIEIDTGDGFNSLGTFQLLSVPYALFAKSAEKLGESDVYSTTTDTLFVVKDHDGKVVFAVFPDGAEVIVNSEAKGKVGGFAISGRSPSKAEDEYYLHVTPDSTQIIINQSTEKGKVGGFAISGRSPSKSVEEDYLIVTADSTRIYVNDTSQTKGKVGGFAISGRSPSKNSINPFVNLTPENYFIGHQSGAANETGLYNSFYGYQTGMDNREGNQNVFIGYKSGLQNEIGNDNLFIGNSSGYNNKKGDQNIFLGHFAGYTNSGGDNNIFIGDSSGYMNNEWITENQTLGQGNIYLGMSSGHNNIGQSNIFLGSRAGYNSDTVSNCIFIGIESGANSQGNKNIFIGVKAGKGPEDASDYSGSYNVFIGSEVGRFNSSGNSNVCIGDSAGLAVEGSENLILGATSGKMNNFGNRNVFLGSYSGYSNRFGDSNIFIGYKAGYYEDISNRLIIENSDTTSDGVLIYGEFDNDIVQINSRLGIGIYPSDTANANLVVKGNIRVADGTFLDDGIVVSDFVFSNDYNLLSIEEHSYFMRKYKHLPHVDSKDEIDKKGGVDMSERREQILEELEIAHIYIDQLNNEMKFLKDENQNLKQKLDEIYTLLKKTE